MSGILNWEWAVRPRGRSVAAMPEDATQRTRIMVRGWKGVGEEYAGLGEGHSSRVPQSEDGREKSIRGGDRERMKNMDFHLHLQ
jgi:hypothetical protein